MKKALKPHGSPVEITTDGLPSYKAAMSELGNANKHEVDSWESSRLKNIHLPFRSREQAMLRLRQMKGFQKFASIHANVHNHRSLERHLIDRHTIKTRRSAAVPDGRNLMA